MARNSFPILAFSDENGRKPGLEAELIGGENPARSYGIADNRTSRDRPRARRAGRFGKKNARAARPRLPKPALLGRVPAVSNGAA